MNHSRLRTASHKISVKKPRLSLVPATKPKLLDQLREALKSRHYSHRTEQTYCSWVKRFIYFHNVRHPQEMAEPEIIWVKKTMERFSEASYTDRNKQFRSLCGYI